LRSLFLGTGTTAPVWAGEIGLMEQFHCTEKELKTEFTAGTIRKISEYNRIKNKVEKEKEQRQQAESHGGSVRSMR